jgi:hypothetical protein
MTAASESIRLKHDGRSPSPLPAGRHVGPYEIVAALEHGDAVASYAALDLRDATEVRLQEFLPRGLCLRGADLDVVVAPDLHAQFCAGLRRFLNLGRTLAHLNAPGLVSVAECWSMSGTGYLVAAAHAIRRLDTWRARKNKPPSKTKI